MVVPPGLAGNGPFAVFAAVFLGVLLGQVRIRGFSLGVSGVLFAGMALGAVGYARQVGPVDVRMSRVVLTQLREVEIRVFLAAVGIAASARRRRRRRRASRARCSSASGRWSSATRSRSSSGTSTGSPPRAPSPAA